jgi:hypothetical protein
MDDPTLLLNHFLSLSHISRTRPCRRPSITQIRHWILRGAAYYANSLVISALCIIINVFIFRWRASCLAVSQSAERRSSRAAAGSCCGVQVTMRQLPACWGTGAEPVPTATISRARYTCEKASSSVLQFSKICHARLVCEQRSSRAAFGLPASGRDIRWVISITGTPQ